MQSPDLSFVVPSISRDMRGQYEAHFPFVWRYMAHRGVPQASLDDLVHSVFRIFREHPSRRDPSRPRNVVICMIARQVLREWKKRHAQVEEADPLMEGDGDGPTRTFSRDAATQMLDATLDQLTETQREVFLLCAGEKLPAREVADALGIQESTVELRLGSAHQRVGAFIERLRSLPMWESMSDMSPKGLLDAAKQARTPTDRDRERIFAAMLASSMTSTPSPVDLLSLPHSNPQTQQHAQVRLPPPARVPQSSPTFASPNVPSPLGYSGWAALACVALVMGTASYIMLSAKRSEPVQIQAAATMAEEAARAQPAAQSPVTVDDVTEQVMPTEAPPPEEARPARKERDSRRAKKPRRSRREAAPAVPRNDDRGARQLFAAERALRSGEPRTALELVRDHASRYPDSELTTERNALRAQILCDLGRTRAARRVVLELEADHAEQPLLASVDQACMGPD